MKNLSIRRVAITVGNERRGDVATYTIFPASQIVEVVNLFPSGETADAGKVSLADFLDFAAKAQPAGEAKP